MHADALTHRLREHGLLGQDPVPPAQSTPVWIAILQGVGGWFGALFFLVFIGSGLSFVRGAPGWFFAGLVLCATAAVLMRLTKGMVVVEQFGLAFSMAGQIAVAIAIEKASLDYHTGLLLFVVYELLLLVLIPNTLHAFIVSAAALVALGALTVPEWGFKQGGPFSHPLIPLYGAATLVLWLQESRWRATIWSDQVSGLAHALVVAIVAASVHLGLPSILRDLFEPGALFVWASWGCTLLALGALAWATHTMPWTLPSIALRAMLVLALVLTHDAPSVAMGSMVLLLGHRRANPTLLFLGTLTLLWGLSSYYYQLSWGFLEKSGLLIASGLALLCCRWLWQQLHQEQA